MKILFINDKSADYIQDLTYSGLVKSFSFYDIKDYPYNQKYHIAYRSYPKNLGYIKNSFFKSFITRFLKNFDYVFLASAKVRAFKAYLKIIKYIPKKTPIIFIDGGDSSKGIGRDLEVYGNYELYEEAIAIRKFDYIFKREYLIDTNYEKNIFPLPMSFNYDRLPYLDYDFKYNLSFWAVESHKIRTDALKLLENKFDCKQNGTVLNQEFKNYNRRGDFYLQELARSKIVLNFRGGGWDTLRYWEVPAIGRFLISQKPRILIPNNFRDKKELIFCKDDLSDLEDLCKFYLKNEDKREEIAKNALIFSKKYHSDKERVSYIFSKIS